MVERRRDNIPNSTQIPNVFIDKLMPMVSPATWKIISFVSRKTYGWGKQWDEISITQIEKGTGLSNRCVIDTMTELRDAGVVLRGEQKSYGWEWSLNLDCDVDEAIERLKPKQRSPRSKPSGGRKKDVSSHEPGSQDENRGHEPSSLGYEQSAGAPSSRAPMNPVHSEPVNPVQLQKPTSLLNKPTIKTKGQNTPTFIIAQKHFLAEIAPFVDAALKEFEQSENPRSELFRKVRVAAKAAGLDYSQARGILEDHPGWRDWQDLEHLDSQREIYFPEPAKPVAAVKVKPEFESDGQLWRQVLDALQTKISRHSFDTWLKPTRAYGIRQKVLYVNVPTPEFRYIGEKFGDLLHAEINGRVTDIAFLTQEELGERDWKESA